MLATWKHLFTFIFAFATHGAFSENWLGLSWSVNIYYITIELHFFHGLVVCEFFTHCMVLEVLQIQLKLISHSKLIGYVSVIRSMVWRLNHVFINFNFFSTHVSRCKNETIVTHLKIQIILLASRTLIIKTLRSYSWRDFRWKNMLLTKYHLVSFCLIYLFKGTKKWFVISKLLLTLLLIFICYH